MLFKVLVFLYAVVALTGGDNTDMCDKIETIQQFDAKKTGGWYVQEVGGHTGNHDDDCQKIDITGVNGLVKLSRRINGGFYFDDNMTMIQEGDTSKYNVKIELKIYMDVSYTHYWVATDYDNFVISYNCVRVLSNLKAGAVSISTRTRNPDAGIIEKPKEAMKMRGFNPDNMTTIKQNDCTN